MLKSRKSILSWYALFFLKLISATLVGFALAVIGQALIGYRYFSLFFIFLTISFAFFTLVKKLGYLGILLIDVCFILLLVLAKVYIVIADSG